MDFNDSPQEAEFRAEARAWLEANAARRTYAGETWKARYGETDGLDAREGLAGEEACRRAGRHHLAQ